MRDDRQKGNNCPDRTGIKQIARFQLTQLHQQSCCLHSLVHHRKNIFTPNAQHIKKHTPFAKNLSGFEQKSGYKLGFSKTIT
jgi:hypothetical protein